MSQLLPSALAASCGAGVRLWSVAPSVLLASATLAVAPSPPEVSTFDGGDEGWVIEDLSCSNYANVLGTYELDWIATGGDTGPNVGRVDPTSNCYFFAAPSRFLGDRSAYLGRTLRFSLRTTVNDWPPGSVLVLVGDGGTVLVHDFEQPDPDWKRYAVPLAAESFRLGSEGGPPVSAGQFAAVLADLEALRISAEYGSEQGEETTFLDRVVFGASLCTGDLNGDGEVNGVDLGVLLGAWGIDDPIADIDGNRMVDGGDLGALLGAWGTCSDA